VKPTNVPNVVSLFRVPFPCSFVSPPFIVGCAVQQVSTFLLLFSRFPALEGRLFPRPPRVLSTPETGFSGPSLVLAFFPFRSRILRGFSRMALRFLAFGPFFPSFH